MDGFAVRAADVDEPGRVLRVVGEIPAGRPDGGLRVGSGDAVRIFTGAVIPQGADAVVMIELTREDPTERKVVVQERVREGQHIRRQGEEVRSGQTVLRPGTPIGPAEVAVLSAVGCTTVSVCQVPSVGVLATGDEVVDSGSTPEPYQVRNSNARSLLAGLERMGLPAHDLGVAPDDLSVLSKAVRVGLAHDVLLITGGVSVGAYDLVRDAVEGLGVEVLFHGVAVRPGKPVLAGRRDGHIVLGLPGNPVSTFTLFEVLVTPVLRRISGYPNPRRIWYPAALRAPLRRKPGRRNFVLATVVPGPAGLEALPSTSRGSGDVLSLARANALLDVPEGAHTLPEGTELPALVWGEPNDWQTNLPGR